MSSTQMYALYLAIYCENWKERKLLKKLVAKEKVFNNAILI